MNADDDARLDELDHPLIVVGGHPGLESAAGEIKERLLERSDVCVRGETGNAGVLDLWTDKDSGEKLPAQGAAEQTGRRKG